MADREEEEEEALVARLVEEGMSPAEARGLAEGVLAASQGEGRMSDKMATIRDLVTEASEGEETTAMRAAAHLIGTFHAKVSADLNARGWLTVIRVHGGAIIIADNGGVENLASDTGEDLILAGLMQLFADACQQLTEHVPAVQVLQNMEARTTSMKDILLRGEAAISEHVRKEQAREELHALVEDFDDETA
jgi:hypothetical protein